MKTYLEDNLENMLMLLKDLVNQDSGSNYRIGVNLVGAMIRKEFEQLDFIVKEIPQEKTGNHLVIQHKDAVAPSILIIAHLDTVFGANTVAKRPFTIVNDRAYGPGVIDMKGSHVSLIYALKALIQSGRTEVLKNLMIIFNSDEEIGSRTSRKLIERLAVGKNCCGGSG